MRWVEQVDSFKYLGITLENKLERKHHWHPQTLHVSQTQSPLCCPTPSVTASSPPSVHFSLHFHHTGQLYIMNVVWIVFSLYVCVYLYLSIIGYLNLYRSFSSCTASIPRTETLLLTTEHKLHQSGSSSPTDSRKNLQTKRWEKHTLNAKHTFPVNDRIHFYPISSHLISSKASWITCSLRSSPQS